MEKALLQKLQSIQPGGFTAAAGFDAVTDQVSRVIRGVHPDGTKEYFRSIAEFAEYLSEKSGLSASLELETVCEKIGGNMAIYANALGCLGVRVRCAGSFGGSAGRTFRQMSPNCACYDICEQAFCQALEFDDGKLMLASMDKLRQITWKRLEERVGLPELTAWARQDNVLALLNWSELGGATALFRNVYRNLLEPYPADRTKYLFMDISDASGRQPKELLELLELLRQFETRRTVVLSVNENECSLLAAARSVGSTRDTVEKARQVRAKIGCTCLVLHLRDRAMGFLDGEEAECPGYFVEQPLFATGGGDNFNAGFTFGLLAGFALRDCLCLGNAVSGFYVRQGKSPELQELMAFLADRKGTET